MGFLLYISLFLKKNHIYDKLKQLSIRFYCLIFHLKKEHFLFHFNEDRYHFKHLWATQEAVDLLENLPLILRYTSGRPAHCKQSP